MINVTVWGEYLHEKSNPAVAAIYPDGMHKCIAGFLSECDDLCVRTATLEEPDHGLTDEVLDNTDVLIWWGHAAHGRVRDDIVQKIYDRVLRGMGLIALHSAHKSKIFMKLMGTSCSLRWRDGAREHLWCVNPNHPIAKGVPADFRLDNEEMYGEYFDIPKPDDVIYLGWFNGGEVFRSGCTFTRGYGKIFYFQPGHETFTSYKNENVQKIIKNAVHFLYNEEKHGELICPNPAPVE